MKRASRVALAAVLASTALAWPGGAMAQSARDKESARALFEQGKSRRDHADRAGALESFKAADAIMKVPTTKLAVARAYAALGMLVEAREAALQVELIPYAGKEAQPFVDARASARELASELSARIPLLTIVIVTPAGTDAPRITIDGVTVPAEGLRTPRRMNPGKHVVAALFSAGEVKKDVELADKEKASVTLDAAELSNHDATAAAPEHVPPSNRHEEVESGGSRSPILWIGLGVTVVGLAVGVTGGLLTLSNKSDVDASCRDGKCPPAGYAALDGARTWATISTLGFVGAGVGAALAGVGLALGRSPAARTGHAPFVAPAISASGAGIVGSF